MSTRADATPAIAPLPRLAILLLAGAAVHLVILVATRTAMGVYLELSVPSVIGYLAGAMPLVLAASLVAGWDRWPAARWWLVAAAIAYGLVALLDVVGTLSMAIGWPPEQAEANPPSTLVRVALLVAASLAAPLLAGAGLWRSAIAAPRLPLLGTAVAIGLLVLVTQIVSVLPALDAVLAEPFLVPVSVAFAFVPVAVAALGVAALRAIPGRYVVPEVLVAIGAMASAAGSAGVYAALSVVRDASGVAWVEPVVNVSQAIGLVGLACVALGFFAARISAPGEP
jgi:hypothetical protein